MKADLSARGLDGHGAPRKEGDSITVRRDEAVHLPIGKLARYGHSFQGHLLAVGGLDGFASRGGALRCQFQTSLLLVSKGRQGLSSLTRLVQKILNQEGRQGLQMGRLSRRLARHVSF